MKINLLIPPSKGKNKVPERIYGCSYQIYAQPNIPLLYAGGILKANGHQLELRDFTFEDNSFESFEKFTKNEKFDGFIIHSVLLSRKIDAEAYKTIRKNNPDAYVVFFGPEPTRVPENYLFDKKCFVVRGEPEITIKNLIEALEQKKTLDNIKGISFLQDKKINHNETFGIIEDLDVLPLPARDLAKKYEHKFYNTKIPSRPHTIMSTNRGCAFRCYFCVPNAISWARELEWRKYHKGEKPPLKIRSAENIIAELRQLKEDGYKSIWIMDDMFLWGKERILKILKELKNIGGIEFGILARVDYINEEICKALSEAGCKIIDLGVESFDQKVLDYVKKDLDSKKIEPAVKTISKTGIIPEINLMMGVSPLETKEDVKKNIQKAIDLDVKYVLFSIATPFPGTELEKKAEENGWIIKEKYSDLVENLDPANKSLMNMPNLSSSELEGLERYAKLKFYFRPAYIWWQLKKVKSLNEFFDLAKTALKILKK